MVINFDRATLVVVLLSFSDVRYLTSCCYCFLTLATLMERSTVYIHMCKILYVSSRSLTVFHSQSEPPHQIQRKRSVSSGLSNERSIK